MTTHRFVHSFTITEESPTGISDLCGFDLLLWNEDVSKGMGQPEPPIKIVPKVAR
jgi:hypothetical protein